MKSLCRACGLEFTSVENFERHRRGKYTHEPPHYGRRCLTVAELEADPRWRLGTGRRWTRNEALPVLRVRPEATISTDPLQG